MPHKMKGPKRGERAKTNKRTTKPTKKKAPKKGGY